MDKFDNNWKNKILKENILEYAWGQFYKFGLKKVKVDDLAAHFSISKRTLYEMFDNKEFLIVACFKRQLDRNRQDIEDIKSKPGSILEKYIYFIYQRIKELNNLHPSFYEDAGKYPMLVKFIQESSSQRNETALDFINKCVDEDLLIKNFNYNIVIDIMNMLLKEIVKNEIYKKYKIEDILNTMTLIMFRGCCTKKGMDILDSISKR